MIPLTGSVTLSLTTRTQEGSQHTALGKNEDVAIVRPGEKIPVDGIVIEGRGGDICGILAEVLLGFAANRARIEEVLL